LTDDLAAQEETLLDNQTQEDMARPRVEQKRQILLEDGKEGEEGEEEGDEEEEQEKTETEAQPLVDTGDVEDEDDDEEDDEEEDDEEDEEQMEVRKGQTKFIDKLCVIRPRTEKLSLLAQYWIAAKQTERPEPGGVDAGSVAEGDQALESCGAGKSHTAADPETRPG
jgi:hypothetical protein